MSDLNFLDLHALRVFVTAAEARSMSAAAVQLGVSQSAVSQSVKALEVAFGCSLVNRQERPLALTVAGLRLATEGATLLRAALDLRQRVIDTSRGERLDLRLGLVDSFAATCGALVARELASGTAKLSIRTGLSPELSAGLAQHQFDVVISTDELDEADRIVRKTLMVENFIVIAPSGTDVRSMKVETLRDLARQLSCIRFNAQSHLGMQIDRALRRHGVQAERRLEVDTSDTLTSMVAANLGWALTTPLCLLQAQQFATAVEIGFVDGLVASRAIHLLARDDLPTSAVERVASVALRVLRTDSLPRLQKLHPKLPLELQLDPNEH